jgi:hypothetical protein
MTVDNQGGRPNSVTHASSPMPSGPAPCVPAFARSVAPIAPHAHPTENSVISGNASEEYKSVCDFMRQYAMMRFYQLALLLGTTGSIVTALASNAVRASFTGAGFLKTGGLIISLAFLVMEYRASSYWHRLRDRGNDLARVLHYQAFPAASRWDPLTTSGASFYLHMTVATLWFVSLFQRLQPGF